MRSVAQPAWPRGWSAGAVAGGTGTVRASRRVRAVQRELHARGYRVGREDGRFGPRTRGAVTWFQIKHGLEPTGRVDAATLAELRTRRDPRVTLTRTAEPTPTPVPLSPWLPSLPRPTSWRRPAAAHAGHDARADRALLASEPAGRARRAAPPDHGLPHRAGLHRPRPGHRERARAGRRRHDRDRHLVRCPRLATRARHPRRPPSPGRPARARRTSWTGSGPAPPAGSWCGTSATSPTPAPDLVETLQWINDADAFVMAVDEWLDPDLPPGRLSAGALVELGEWRNRRVEARGLAPDLRRPGAPLTGGRHARTGDALQAIADALNAAGVPTLRGGSHWRPSSVQVLAGYKPPPAHEPIHRNRSSRVLRTRHTAPRADHGRGPRRRRQDDARRGPRPRARRDRLLREPGGVELSERIRALVKDPALRRRPARRGAALRRRPRAARRGEAAAAARRAADRDARPLRRLLARLPGRGPRARGSRRSARSTRSAPAA